MESNINGDDFQVKKITIKQMLPFSPAHEMEQSQ